MEHIIRKQVARAEAKEKIAIIVRPIADGSDLIAGLYVWQDLKSICPFLLHIVEHGVHMLTVVLLIDTVT